MTDRRPHLEWRTLVNKRHRWAPGRWPGEEYHLEKGVDGWRFRFVGERGEYEQIVLRGVTFAQARRAAVHHFNIPL